MTTQTYAQSAWSLADLFTGSADVDAAIVRLEQDVAEFEILRPTLSADIPADQFFAIVKKLEAMQEQGYRLYGFSGLGFAADTQDQGALSLMGRIEQFMADMGNRTLFFSLWWKALDERRPTRLMTGSRRLPLLAGRDAPFQTAHPH